MASTDQAELIRKNIANLKELFSTSTYASLTPVKVLENVGEHAFVIKFQPFEAYDLKMTLQIPKDCQLKGSHLIITSKSHGTDKVVSLKQKLEELLSNSDSSLVDFYCQAHKLIEAEFAKEAAPAQNASKTSGVLKSKSDEKVRKTSSPKKSSAEQESEKKSSMKTAADVVNRIQWDEQINKGHITVGYLDRFLGIKECAFNTFDWGDIVLADLGALAIPEHRINYFKYKNATVWDKNTRLDNFFGSTGSNQTIHDIIEQMKDVVDFNAAVGGDNDDDEEEKEVGKKSRKLFDNDARAPGPNYFVSIPVESSQVIRNLEDLKYELADYDPRAEDMLVPETSHHLTLCTLHAGSREELDAVKKVLADLSQDEEFMRAHLPVTVSFSGIDEFFNKVLYVNCHSDELDKLASMKRTIEEKLREAGVNMAGNHYDFVPHLTVLKISTKSAGHKNLTVSQLLSRDLRKKYDKFEFGTHQVTRVDLCKMVNIFDCKTYPVEYSIRHDL